MCKGIHHGLQNIRLDLLTRRPKKKKDSLYLAFIDNLNLLFIQILYLLVGIQIRESTGSIYEVRWIMVYGLSAN